MQTLSPEYCEQLHEMHLTHPQWGTSGGRWANEVSGLIIVSESETVLDYGCGKGVLIGDLRRPEYKHGDVTFYGYDPAVKVYAEPPEPADLVVCTDVMEHIEPDHLHDVFEHIDSLANKSIFFVIAMFKARHVLPDGRNAHLIVQGAQYWLDHIHAHYAAHADIDAQVDESRQELIVKVHK